MTRKSQWQWSQFGQLQTCADLEDYFLGKEKGTEYEHSNYYHYTSLDTIDSILNGQSFWLTSVCGFNDTLDTAQFGSEKDVYFSLCFSTGVSENLSLWYLYSGLDGKGGRLRMTSGGVRDLIHNENYQFVCAERMSNRKENILDRFPLEFGKTIDIRFKDMIYVQEPKEEKNETVRLKYNTMTNYKISIEEFEAYRQKNRGFCKGLIWYYEKETRLLARIKGETAQRLQNWKKEREKREGITYRIELQFPEDFIRRMQIGLAPNIRNDRNEIKELLKNKPGIQKLVELTSPIRPSEYAGTIDFKFKTSWCKNCKQNQNGKR